MSQLTRQLFSAAYQNIFKPVAFQLDPELVHNLIVSTGKFAGESNLGKLLLNNTFAYKSKNLPKNINGILFPNPVGLSAGFDYNGNLTETLPAVGFGFMTIGTVTWQPYAGNPKPRLARLPKSRALIVNKGLKNIGAQAIAAKLEDKDFAIPVGISIASTNKSFSDTKAQIADILASFDLFEYSAVQHSYYELNISCPNTFGGEPFTSPNRLDLLLTTLDKLKINRPIYLKMPVDLKKSELLGLLAIASKHQVAGVVLGNLTKDKSNPAVEPTDKQIWQRHAGHLSGKPTWQRSNKLIKITKQTYKNRFTIIGTGGIFSPADATHKIELGADLVQLITGMIYKGPQLVGDINYYLANR